MVKNLLKKVSSVVNLLFMYICSKYIHTYIVIGMQRFELSQNLPTYQPTYIFVVPREKVK
jgi:hypothetical protein